jgi:hypothetical protein
MEEMKYKPLSDERELDGKRKHDDYIIQRNLKYAAMVGVIIAGTVVLLVLILRFLTDQVFQNQIIDIIKANLAGIIFFILAMLGFQAQRNRS